MYSIGRYFTSPGARVRALIGDSQGVRVRTLRGIRRSKFSVSGDAATDKSSEKKAASGDAAKEVNTRLDGSRDIALQRYKGGACRETALGETDIGGRVTVLSGRVTAVNGVGVTEFVSCYEIYTASVFKFNNRN